MHRGLRFAFEVWGGVLLSSIFSAGASAGLILDVEVRGTYEDNVVGLLSDKGVDTKKGAGGMTGGPMAASVSLKPSDMGSKSPKYTGSSAKSQGDFSVNIFADVGGYRDISDDAYVFLKGAVEHTSYSRFTEFDSTVAGVSGGINRDFGDVLSARVAASGKLKRFGDTARNSAAYAGSLGLKEKLTPKFWLKESYEYEKNNADTAPFSYAGNSVSIGAGYQVTRKILLTAGYNYLVREYEEPSGFKVTSHTVSLGAERELNKNWYLGAGYDRQMSSSSTPGTSVTDNILSVGIRYSY